MAALLIDSSEVAVLEGSGEMSWEDQRHVEPAFSRKIRSTTHSATTVLRVWPIETARMSLAAGEALWATLTAPGTVEASGDLIGETVTCRVREPHDLYGPGADDMMLRFELVEVG